MSQAVRHELQIQIDQLTREILDATEKAWEAQKNKQLKQHTFWLGEKKILTEERTILQKKLHQTPNDKNSIKPKTRQEIKDKIVSLNKMAQAADNNMRTALDAKQLSQANTYLRQRNQFNSEVRHLNELLMPANYDRKKKERKKAFDREKIKKEIKEYNKKAMEADKKMRAALQEKKLEKANELLQQRNYLNTEVKKLTSLINSSEKKENNNKKAEEKPITNASSKKIKATEQQPIKDEKPSLQHEGGKSTPETITTLSKEELKKKIHQCNKQAQIADKAMRVALGDKKLLKANELLQQRNRFNTQAKELLKKLKEIKTTDQAKQNITPIKEKKVLSRKELKNKLKDANRRALDADKAMRIALKAKQYKRANKLLILRNKFNADGRKISLLLNPITSTLSKEQSKTTKIKPNAKDNTQKKSIVKPKKEIPQTEKVPTSITHSVDKSPVSFATHIAEKIINYRLGFIKFFYKRRELQQQIIALKTIVSNDDKQLLALKDELKQHLKHPPKAYVEDHAHNDVILHLLDKVDERGIACFNFPEITASTIGAPLKQLTKQQDFNEFIQHYTEVEPSTGDGKRVLIKYFIRDIIQVKCSLTISDLLLQDAIMDTATVKNGFVNLFDTIIDKANQEIIRLQDESDDPLMPKVLRPLGRFDSVAHRDAIQLIPPMENGIDQFSGAILFDTTVQDNVISSAGKLQGIFSTDGAFRNLKIINNKIKTRGAHKISILGMLSGEVRNNTDLQGNPLDIKIQPLRLGGGTAITNFFILGFSENCSYQYDPIKGISGTKFDRRSKKVVQGAGYDPRKYFLNFNMDRFIQHYQRHAKIQGRFEAIKDCIDTMIKNGDAVKCNPASLEALEKGASLKEAVIIAKKLNR